MALRVLYGYDDAMTLEVNNTTVTIDKVECKQELTLELVNDRNDIEFVVTQVTDENSRLLPPASVDVKDPNLVLFTFIRPFTGIVYIVACRSGAIEKLNTEEIVIDSLVKQVDKIWINQYTKKVYSVKVVAIERL